MSARRAALQSLRDLTERNAHLHGEDTHLIFGERHSTFRSFADRSMRLASALYGLGMRSQDRVAMLAMNCPEYLEVYGACEVAAYIIATVNFRLAAPEMEFILRDSGPRVLIFEQQYAQLVSELRPRLQSIEHYVAIGEPSPQVAPTLTPTPTQTWTHRYEDLLANGDSSGPPLRPRPDDIHSITYTSGTTGKPKGAMLSHECVLALFATWSQELGADLGHKILLAMPFFHIGARSQGGAVTYRGGTLVVHRTFDAREIVKTVERERITQLHLAPTLMQAVLDLPDIEQFDLSSLRTVNYAAAPMPLKTLKRAMKRFGPILINGYGQTEGAGTVLRKHYHRPEGTPKDLERLTSVGQPVLDTRARIADEYDRDVPIGTVGELCLQSPQNMVGYWNNSAATIEALREGWLHTGDLARQDEDGFIYLVDRKKDMIVSGGENVYSREVEEALMSHPAVADAAVIGVPDEKWGEAVKGIVVCKAGATSTAAELVAHCRTLIAGYKCPKSVEFITELPRLPSGKVSKVSLRERYGREG
jgi:acyl-CoA synthetase (AMP-forming)/AMP-acid ligase II